MLRRERRRGGRGDRVKEEAGAVGGTDDGYIGTVDVKRYNFYSLFFFTDFRGPRLFFFWASAFIALMILSGRLRGREVTISKKFFSERVRAWGKGILGRVRGGGREMRDQDSRVSTRT